MDSSAWIESAHAAPYREHWIQVEGCPIHFLRWGDGTKPGLVLVHGGAAHAQWWRFVAPFLMQQYDVVALDLSGHGDSGRRDAYPRELWAREIFAVSEAASFPGPPVLIGHSLGGLVSIIAAALRGDALAGALIVDSPVYKLDPESQAWQGRTLRAAKVYPDLETAMSHFHLVPDQPGADPAMLEHVARTSLKEVEGGWTWKFDPSVFWSTIDHPMPDYLARVRCRIALLRGEFSAIVPVETAEYMDEVLDRTAPLVEIPQAYHHLMFDQPLALITAIRALLADWEHSIPRRLP